MLEMLLRLMAEIGSQVTWVFVFIAATVTAFVVYIGIAMHAVLHRGQDPAQQEVSYRVFRDLLELFRRGRRR